jgi:RNA polymerase sigma factor (sigma-70 family)
MDIGLAKQWERCKAGDSQAREALILRYAWLAPKTAGYVHRRNWRGFELEDLAGVAYLSLIKALDNYDLTSKARFETYAISVITGHLMHYIRDNGRVPRQSVDVTNKAKIARGKLDCAATNEDVAISLNISVDCLERHLRTAQLGAVIEMDAPMQSGVSFAETIPDSAPSPFNQMITNIQGNKLGAAINRLPPDQQDLLAMRFRDGLTRCQIGELTGKGFRLVMREEQSALSRLRRLLDPVLFGQA